MRGTPVDSKKGKKRFASTEDHKATHVLSCKALTLGAFGFQMWPRMLDSRASEKLFDVWKSVGWRDWRVDCESNALSSP